MKKTCDFSVVVPVYNSQHSLNDLYQRLKDVFDQMGMVFEVIFVNDCSSDDSLEVLHQLHGQFENIKVINLYKNNGQQNALMCGLNNVSGSYIITIDDDLQNPPEEIPILFEKLNEGYDAVFGAISDKKDKFYKNIGSFIIRKLNHRIFNLRNDLRFSSFRIIRREIVNELMNMRTPFPYISGMIMSITYNVGNAEIAHHEREIGKSNYTIKKLISLAFNLLINYSSIPLQAVIFAGLVIASISFFIGIFFFMKQLALGLAPAGWTSIIVLISFLSTVFFIISFIFGIYISRILREISMEKQYFIKDILK